MFGSEDNKRQDETLKALCKNQEQMIKNQNVLIKNNDYFIKSDKDLRGWITKLDNDNKAQTSFDNMVAKELQDIKTKLSDYLTLANTVKELQKQVATLQTNKGDVEG